MRVSGLATWCKESGHQLSDVAALARVNYATARNIARGESNGNSAPAGAALVNVLRAAEKLGAEVVISVNGKAQS